ncbi:C-terminal binding protein [Clostridium tyrobutyricum]|uniref:C-terminal binding protein n=1 Tax=Clostridium tyrobutyricum TaxID=1519 RepID=UPI001C392D6A|nr:C-terminal binding protein [Clostridium tyrobutyricum]
MKILVSDYPGTCSRDTYYEEKILKEHIKDVQVVFYEYSDENKEGFLKELEDADGLITAFIKIDSEVLDRATKLKCISINATGYNNVDIEELKARKIGLCNVHEYCTQEVAAHTLALILSLSRQIKHYQNDIEEKNIWDYNTASGMRRIKGQTLAIFGLGRIGQVVAKMAQAFGMKVIAVDAFLPLKIAKKLNVKMVDKETALKDADIISNHMNQTDETTYYFAIEEFQKMKKCPIFINVARGAAVKEEDMITALDKGFIRGAGLDVLEAENPVLKDNPLLHRENVILTPHAAFCSETSMKDLQRISCENMVYFLNGEYEKVFKMIY